MRSSRRHSPLLLLPVLLLLLVGARLAYAGELVYLALQREGQASVAIDEKKKAAYIIDLGRGGDGEQVKLNNLPLLDRLERAGVRDLSFVCSHPHSDHMGGIVALFKDPRAFFKDGDLSAPRFKSITVVDDGVPNKLHVLLRRFMAGNKLIEVKYIPATAGNAFAGISQKTDDVYVETIPYGAAGKGGPHGRAVITYIQLGQGNTVVDFDDADSAAIRRAVNVLKARGESQITTFVVPHHGSRYHDVKPILELNPKYAIISVNPENRYGHPSPPVLLEVMKQLGKENVLFTGSVEHVVLDQNGVKSAKFTAAIGESYGLFVAPNRLRAERLGNTADVEACALIQEMMKGNTDDPPPAGAVRPGGPSPKGPRRGGPSQTFFEEIVKRNGSILQPEFEFGAISYGRDGAPALRSKKIFAYPLTTSTDLTGQDVAVVLERSVRDSRTSPSKLTPPEARQVSQQLKLLGNNADKAKAVYVYSSSPVGLPDVLEPTVVTNPQELALLSVVTPTRPGGGAGPRPGGGGPSAGGGGPAGSGSGASPRGRGTQPGGGRPRAGQAGGRGGQPAVAQRRARVPSGGMVFLQGGKLFPVGEATELLGGTLDVCGAKLCVRTSGGGGAMAAAYTLPFSPGPLFSEVWTRVVDRRVNSFYLSINPTKQFLRNLDSGFDNIPTGRLRFGASAAGTGSRTHEVVTAGDIENTRIGQILWEADVAFKSASLGFDVLTGRAGGFGGAGPRSPAQKTSENQLLSLRVPYRERWCRLYWTSGSQSISVNATSNQISFVGDAVVANAEPMVMRNGKLVDASFGTWCGDSKSVAASLQGQANSGGPAPAILKQLRELAEIQTFVRWARDNELAATDAFRQSVAQHNSPAGGVVPTWTSGIKSDPQVRVRQQGSLAAGSTSTVLHISLAESSTWTNCVSPNWALRERDFPENGVHRRPDGIWNIPPEKNQFVDDWMAGLARRIAACSGGQLLGSSPAGRRSTFVRTGQANKEIGVIPHPQAVHMHGGVMLGVQRGFLDSAREKGLLLSVSRKPYFQKAGDRLHFWNHTDEHPRFGSFGQHAVIDGGSVTEVSARNGLLTFQVKTEAGAVALHESRWGRAGDYARGLEWAGARHGGDGSWIWAKAAWPCADGPGCVSVSGASLDKLRSEIGARRGEDWAVSLTRVAENEWRVELNISGVRPELDRRWKEISASDVNARLSMVYEYAKWGFITDALKRYFEVAAEIEGDTEDTILIKLLEAAPVNDETSP